MFESQCDNLFDFQPTTQTDTAPDKYTDTPIRWNLTPFTVDPVECADTITYTVSNILDPAGFNDYFSDPPPYDLWTTLITPTFDGVLNGDATDGVIDFQANPLQYERYEREPGTWTIHITGTDLSGTSFEETFIWELVDPCILPSIVITPILLPDYVISDDPPGGIFNEHPAVTIEPNYCEVKQVLTMPDTNDQNLVNVANAAIIIYNDSNPANFNLYYDLYPDILDAPLYQNKLVEFTYTS